MKSQSVESDSTIKKLINSTLNNKIQIWESCLHNLKIFYILSCSFKYLFFLKRASEASLTLHKLLASKCKFNSIASNLSNKFFRTVIKYQYSSLKTYLWKLQKKNKWKIQNFILSEIVLLIFMHSENILWYILYSF